MQKDYQRFQRNSLATQSFCENWGGRYTQKFIELGGEIKRNLWRIASKTKSNKIKSEKIKIICSNRLICFILNKLDN